jgi:hypothetical protein
MDGQGRCKHARETGNKVLLDEYNNKSLRAKKDKSVLVIEIVPIYVEAGACRNQ